MKRDKKIKKIYILSSIVVLIVGIIIFGTLKNSEIFSDGSIFDKPSLETENDFSIDVDEIIEKIDEMSIQEIEKTIKEIEKEIQRLESEMNN